MVLPLDPIVEIFTNESNPAMNEPLDPIGDFFEE
jgi:hypothetical protein